MIHLSLESAEANSLVNYGQKQRKRLTISTDLKIRPANYVTSWNKLCIIITKLEEVRVEGKFLPPQKLAREKRDWNT